MRLLLTIDDQAVHSVPVTGALHFGRSPHNDVVLPVQDVSAHHAVVTPTPDGLVVHDLGSTNGTFLGDQRVRTPTLWPAHVALRLGRRVVLRNQPEAPSRTAHWRLVPVAGGAARDVPDDGLQLDETTRLVADDDGWWFLTAEGRTPVGDSLAFQGVSYQLVEQGQVVAPTARVADAPALHLTVHLTDALATLTGPSLAKPVRFRSDLRTSLLYVLGKAWLQAQASHAVADEHGWVADEVLQRQVWGVAARRHGANNLNVLVHRIRASAEKAGVPGDFLDKLPGRTRLRVQDVQLID